jgi:CheY-like chemotaxis protein
MPRGGPLTITAGLVTVDSGYKEREPDALLGTFLRVSVADEGTGMDEKVRRKIFEPFFSTKEVGKGTGMGLATVYGIVKQHQGWIEVDTKLGVGSVFSVFLPLTDRKVQNETEPRPSQIWTTKVEQRTILVVEDETPLRDMAAKILKRFGHQPLLAKDGPEGYNLWRQHRGKIDLLFTDMVMPGGMTGRELADCILREEPKMPVIYSTGYSMDLSNSGINLVEGVNFLRKPYDATTLAQAVKTALAQSTKPPSNDGSSRQV